MGAPRNNFVTGIDVSHHQGTIDWQRVKESGCDFAFIKATEGKTFVDRNFKRNREAAKQAGVIVGAYHFYRTTSSPEEQVENLFATIGSVYPDELPPAIDLEIPGQWKFSRKECCEIVINCIQAVSARLDAKRRPLIYLSPSFAREILDNDESLETCALWLAHWTQEKAPRVPSPWTSWTFWQWSNKGRLNGIEADVDLDYFNGDYEQFQLFLNKK